MKTTTLCYIRCGDEVLLLHRTKKEKDLNEGKWIGVGGKAEPGETPEECIRREVFEETGFAISDFTYRGRVRFLLPKWGDEDSYVYIAEVQEKTVIECSEGDLEWVPIDRVESLPTWEGDHYFLPKLWDGTPPFTLTLEYDFCDVLQHVFWK